MSDQNNSDRRLDPEKYTVTRLAPIEPPPPRSESEYGTHENGAANSHSAAPAISPALKAQRLRDMRFDPIKYVVPGVIVEGLTLCAGKPKIGKSWLMLHAAIAVAKTGGGFTLGDIHCPEGDVLYCALEDNLRRLQSRMTKLLGIYQEWPERLEFRCDLPRLAEGGLDVIRAWITGAERPRLVIIDTLAMVRPAKGRNENPYDADYLAVKELRELASAYGVAIVLVHHLRKADSDDAFDAVSGTLGLTGGVDSVLVIKRDSSGNFVLHGRGRDLAHIEKAIDFSPGACTWTITGNASDARITSERQAILEAIREVGGEGTPKDIAEAGGLKHDNVKKTLTRMARTGQVKKTEHGKYVILNPVAEKPEDHSPGDT